MIEMRRITIKELNWVLQISPLMVPIVAVLTVYCLENNLVQMSGLCWVL